MSQEDENKNIEHRPIPLKKQANLLIYIAVILVVFFIIGKLFPITYTPKPADISAVANLTENELIFMKCDTYEELNKDSQIEVGRKMFAYYKLPITEDEIKERREDVLHYCGKESDNKVMRGYVKVYLGIMEGPNLNW